MAPIEARLHLVSDMLHSVIWLVWDMIRDEVNGKMIAMNLAIIIYLEPVL